MPARVRQGQSKELLRIFKNASQAEEGCIHRFHFSSQGADKKAG